MIHQPFTFKTLFIWSIYEGLHEVAIQSLQLRTNLHAEQSCYSSFSRHLNVTAVIFVCFHGGLHEADSPGKCIMSIRVHTNNPGMFLQRTEVQ